MNYNEVEYATDRDTFFAMKDRQKLIGFQRKNKNYTYSTKYARHFNIVYSMLKGRLYKEVENKVRENNEQSSGIIKDIIREFGIDESFFFENGKLK